MKISLFVSLCCGVAFYSSAVQAACVQPPSCEELGFTVDASKCDGSFLKCPWNTDKAACNKNKITTPTELPILYGDGTIAKGIIDGKTPIGIVFDETNKLAMALSDVKKDGSTGSEAMSWSEIAKDIPGLANCKTQYAGNLTASCDIEGQINTTLILNCGNWCGQAPAANACHKYEPVGCTEDFCKKTKWFLPSMRDWFSIYALKSKIATSLSNLKSYNAVALDRYYYWSSVEASSSNAIIFLMSSGYETSYLKTEQGSTSTSIYVRPIIYYGTPRILSRLPVLYGDGTISKEIFSNKTPIGIVFDEKNKLAVALTNVNKDGTPGKELMFWLSGKKDIPNLSSCSCSKDTINECNKDGQLNTTLILSNAGTETAFAAHACHKYEPQNCTKNFCKKTKWFLPSMSELMSIYMVRSQIDASLTLLGIYNYKTEIMSGSFFSSVERDYMSVCTFDMYNGLENFNFWYKDANKGSTYVRPVVHYE